MTDTKSKLEIDRLSAFIKQRRKDLGLTQADVARAIGIKSSEFIYMVENNLRQLELNKIPALAIALQVNPADLCRVALREAHPLLYNAICEDAETGRVSTAKPGSGQAAGDVMTTKFMALPAGPRQLVRSLVDTLYESLVTAPTRL